MLKNLYVFFMVLSFTGCSSSKKNTKEIARFHLDIGMAHLNNGKYPEGLAELLKAKRLDPDNPIILNHLSLGYFVRERYFEAEKWLLRSIQLKPNYMEAHNNLGRVYIEMGKYDKAIEQLKIVLSDLTYSTPEKAQFNLATAYFRKGEYIKSRDLVQLVWKTNEFHCSSFVLYARSLYELKDYEEAQKAFEKSLLKCKKGGEGRMPEIRYYNALALYKRGQKGESLKKMQNIIKLHPKSPYAKRASIILRAVAK